MTANEIQSRSLPTPNRKATHLKDQTTKLLTTQKVNAVLRKYGCSTNSIYDRVRKTRTAGVIEIALLLQPNDFRINQMQEIIGAEGWVYDKDNHERSMVSRWTVTFLVSYPPTKPVDLP